MAENPRPQISNVEARQVAEEIARQLKEANPEALDQIELIVKRLGTERTQEFLEEALETEARGGLMVRNGSRRRTPGGTFFYLVRNQISAKDRWAIWPHLAPRPKTPPLPFEWEKRLEIVPKLLKKIGEANSVKITLIGRPGRIVQKRDVVLMSMKQRNDKAPSLPKGLPPLPEEPTVYLVYIARKQWRKVAKAIKDPDDVLIVEGLPVFDKRLGAVAVFTRSVTTKLLQAAKREAQKGQ